MRPCVLIFYTGPIFAEESPDNCCTAPIRYLASSASSTNDSTTTTVIDARPRVVLISTIYYNMYSVVNGVLHIISFINLRESS